MAGADGALCLVCSDPLLVFVAVAQLRRSAWLRSNVCSEYDIRLLAAQLMMTLHQSEVLIRGHHAVLGPWHHVVPRLRALESFLDLSLVPNKFFVHGFVDTAILAGVARVHRFGFFYLDLLFLARVGWDHFIWSWLGPCRCFHLSHWRLLTPLLRLVLRWVLRGRSSACFLLFLKHLHDHSLRRWGVKFRVL